MEGLVEHEPFWPFGPIDEPDDTRELFGSFSGVSGGETRDSAFTIEKGPVRELELRGRIAVILAAISRALVVMAMNHYLRLSFGNPLYPRMVLTNTKDSPKKLRASPARRKGRLSRLILRRGRQAHCSNLRQVRERAGGQKLVRTLFSIMPLSPDCVTCWTSTRSSIR